MRSADGLKIHVVTTKLFVDTVDLVSRKVVSSFPLSVSDGKSSPRMLRSNGGGGFSGAYTGDGTISLPGLTYPGLQTSGGKVTTASNNVGVQGNFDPFLLTTTPEIVVQETNRLLCEMRGTKGHIFNLGHGVPRTAMLENIQALVQTVKNFK